MKNNNDNSNDNDSNTDRLTGLRNSREGNDTSNNGEAIETCNNLIASTTCCPSAYLSDGCIILIFVS